MFQHSWSHRALLLWLVVQGGGAVAAMAPPVGADDLDLDDGGVVPAAPPAVSAPPAGAKPAPVADQSSSWFPGLFAGGAGDLFGPLKYSGELSETLTGLYTGDTRARFEVRQIVLRGESYLWRPWLATVNGNIQLARSSATADSAGSTQKGGASSLAYGLGGTLLPRTRVPLRFSVGRSESRVGAETITSSNYDLQQDYRSAAGGDTGNLRLGRSWTTGADTRNWGVNYDRRHDPSQWAINATGYDSLAADSSRTRSVLVGGRHARRWDDYELGYSSSASHSQQNAERPGADGGRSAATADSVGAGLQWLPLEEVEWRLGANASVSRFVSESSGATGDSALSVTNITADLDSRYDISRQSDLRSTLTASRVAGNATQATVVVLNNAYGYRGEQRLLAGWNYNWNAGAGLGASRFAVADGPSATNTTLSGSLGHSGTRSLALFGEQNVGASLSQGVQLGLSGPTFAGGLSHGASLSHTRAVGGGTRYLTLSASDSLSFGDSRNHGANWSASYGQGWPLTRLSALNASFSYTESYSFGTQSGSSPSRSATAGLGYSNAALFLVPRLAYSAQLTAVSRLSSSSQGSAASAGRVGWSLLQRLNYRLAKISFEGNATISDPGDGNKNATIYLRLLRDFGN